MDIVADATLNHLIATTERRSAERLSFLTPTRNSASDRRPLGEGNRPLGLGGKRLDLDGIAKVFKAFHQALGLRVLGTAVEMVDAEILIDGSVFQHVDAAPRRRWLWGARGGCGPQVLSLLFCFWRAGRRRSNRLCRGAQWLKTTSSIVQSAPRGLVVARTQACPRQQMPRSGEATEVGTNLGDDGLGAELANARMGAHDFDSGAKGREVGYQGSIHPFMRPFDD